ncbi:CdaR family transcriptional regulator [uncultured Mycolicibacterium sp.]|uniref:PucR family transcriptional regulator n=1 Tax=uncultured Mycolicibacterium sp. TaxID=2320817 RepID=UPI00260BE1BD|nr:PucR family transcriptional regulator [uncultured Mycolicibacterium sp.]
MPGAVPLTDLVAAGILSVAARGAGDAVSAVHIHPESERPQPHSLIIGLDAGSARAQRALLEAATAAHPAVLVVRRPAPEPLARRCAERAVTLAELAPGVDWSHLIWLVRSLIDRAESLPGSQSAAQQGLFAMADAFAALLGAPVTIEDAHSRVVAYSATSEGLDPTRTETIVNRTPPPEVLRKLRASGVLKRLLHDTRPFIVPAMEPGFRRRLVIPLRAGDQPVGSIWAIWDGELDPALEAQLTVTATAAAMSLVQFSTGADLAGRYTVETTRAALRGEAPAGPRTWEMPFSRCRVVALQRLSQSRPEQDVALWHTFLRKKSWPDPVLADVDGLVYAVVPDRPGAGGWTWLAGLADTAPGRIGASRPVTDTTALPAARQEATDVLAALAELDLRVAGYEQVWDAVVLRRAATAVAGLEHSELRRLRDAGPDTRYLTDTVRTWLECGGDINRTAAALHTHPNTVRHRLRKLDGLIETHLDTPARRTAALLLLRGWDQAGRDRPGCDRSGRP